MRTAQLLIGSWAVIYAVMAFAHWDVAWIAGIGEWTPFGRFGLAHLAVCGPGLMLVAMGDK